MRKMMKIEYTELYNMTTERHCECFFLHYQNTEKQEMLVHDRNTTKSRKVGL